LIALTTFAVPSQIMPELQPPPALPKSEPFLYITLRQQDSPLLMGTIALFVLLAVGMFVTHKVDWYARDVG
jgi:inner membrane protein involved in colicin E2 resistance